MGCSRRPTRVFPGKSGTTYLERWVNIGSKVPDVGIRQTLEGIPDGKYRLRAAVGNIQQNGANSTVNAGEKQTGVTLYAGIYDMPVDTMKVYKDLYFTVVDGQVTIGFKAENATATGFASTTSACIISAGTPRKIMRLICRVMPMMSVRNCRRNISSLRFARRWKQP